jgi:hypothetical protein
VQQALMMAGIQPVPQPDPGGMAPTLLEAKIDKENKPKPGGEQK